MTFVDSLLSTSGDDGLLVLISLGLWSIIVLSIAWLITGCMRRTSAATRCCVWQFAIVVVLLIPVLQTVVPGIPLGWRSEATDVATAEPRDRIDFSQNSEENSLDDSEASRSKPVASNAATTAKRQKTTSSESTVSSNQPITESEQSVEATYLPTTHMSWSNVILTIWTIGVLGNLCWLVCSVLRARRLVRSASTDVDVRLKTMLAEVAEQMSWSRPIRLSVSSRVRVPLVMGPFRPRIVMPVEWTDWSPARIRIVLSHEVAHVVRRDVAWQLVTRLAAAVYWINPLVWLAVRKVRTERETACDDVVLLAGVTATDYAAGLVEMVAELGGRRLNLLGAMGMAEQPQIRERLQAILDERSCRTPVSRHMRRVFLLGTISLAISLAMLRPFDSVAGVTDETQVSQKEPLSSSPPDAEVQTVADSKRVTKGPTLDNLLPRFFSERHAAAPIENAVKDFNEQVEIQYSFNSGEDEEQPWRQPVLPRERLPSPLKVSEIIRAIRNTNWSEYAKGDYANAAGIYQKIVETNELPSQWRLRYRDNWMDPNKREPNASDRFEYRTWSIRLTVDLGENRGYSLPVREQKLDKRIAFRPAVGYSWLRRPRSPQPYGSRFTSDLIVSIDEHPRGSHLVTVVRSARLSDGGKRFGELGPIRELRAVAFDAEGKRYLLKRHNGGGGGSQFTMQLFLLDPDTLDPADAQYIGIEVARENSLLVSSRAAIKEAKEKGIDVLSLPEVGKPYPFKLKTPSGQVIDSEKLRGKVVLIDCWASWCLPCMQKMPGLKSIYNKWHNKGLEVVGVSYDKKTENAQLTYKQLDISWPLISVPRDEEPRRIWLEANRISTLPRVLLIDKQGVLRFDMSKGPFELEKHIESLLE